MKLVHDLRFTLRSLRRRPLYTAVVVLTLGLGIGSTTAMFSVVNGVMLKPLPFDEPDRLVAIWQTWPQARGLPGDDGARWDRTRLTYAQYRDLSEHSTLYEGLAAYRAGTPDVATLTGVDAPVELRAGAASASLLAVLGVRPVRGRWFLPEEEASGVGGEGAPVAVVSYELWQTRFGGSTGILGRAVTIDDRPFMIIGVLPRGFRIQWLSATAGGEGDPGMRDVWFPIGAPGSPAWPQTFSWETIGRLASRVTIQQARAETRTILERHPDTYGEARVLARAAEASRGLAAPLVLLLGATAFLMIIACGNVATLSTAEMVGRQPEIATRSALGADGTRILRLLLTETAVLAALGTAIGAAAAVGGSRVLVRLAPPIPRLHEVAVDSMVLGFAVLMGICAVILSGTVPWALASRHSVGPTLHGSPRMSLGHWRFTRVVVGAEIAVTAMLLVAGGLLTRSFNRLMAVDPGFDTSDLTTVEVRLPLSRYPSRESRVAFFRDALDRLRGVTGIGTVTAVSRLPFPGYTSAWRMQIAGRDAYVYPLGYQVAPGYLETLGVPLLAGRSLAETDGPGAPLAVVINETMARRYWPGESPIGARLDWGGSPEPVTVVGVVGDMRRQVLNAGDEPAFFIPFSQLPDESICFVARTQAQPSWVIPLMREALTSVDEDLVVKNANTMVALVAQSASQQRYLMLLTTFFGLLAALLAAAGVFGVTARSVALRTREMGIRMALGASTPTLVGRTVGDALLLALAGTAVGLLGATWISELLVRFLYDIEPADPSTYGAVAVLTLIVCALAAYVPARRIANLAPVDVLKAQ